MQLEFALFVDVEASGFGPSSWPVEVGWCDIHGTGSAALIRPDRDWTHWDQAAAETHGISREDLARNGLDRQDAAAQFLAATAGRHLFSDSPEDDAFWLQRMTGLVLEINDAESLAAALAAARCCSWPEIERAVITAAPRRHRALDDARYLSALVRFAAGMER